MNYNFFRLSNFLTESEFLKLQKYFISIDYYNSYGGKFPILKNNPEIVIQDIDFLNDDAEEFVTIEITQNFIEDFIVPGIYQIHNNEMIDFIKTCNDKGFVTKQFKEGYALEIKNKFKNIESDILKLNFLSENVQVLLLKEINIFNSELNRYINNPYPKLFNKLNVKSNRAQIEAIFYLILKNNKFDKATKGDVGRIIDTCFNYEESPGNYKQILRANSHLAELEENGGPSKLAKNQIKKALKEFLKSLS